MVCIKCHKTCLPIGATLRGVQLVGCPNCSAVYADIPGAKIVRRMPATTSTRGEAAVARHARNQKVTGSRPAPVIKGKDTSKATKRVKKPASKLLKSRK